MKTLDTLFPGVSQVVRLTETESTQTVARVLADQGAPSGTIVWADRQTAGRGRLSRKWSSPPGGLYVSLILRPRFSAERLADLSLKTARTVAEALSKEAGIETTVKPPNDVLALSRGRPKKICGILAETSGTSRRLDWLVIGIGVNVNNRPPLATSTSLKALTGRSWDLEKILTAILSRFQRQYARLDRSPR